ncbi:LuxR C-terminal-related transcriptional regulator [Streptomyces brasiliscabiei]|uniref:LuxR C-terminal-related transcriptional regulator n=1 Tax=Streptomyces brasiliscabiei TaxID=2736302 RepID=UPI0030152776
MPAPDETISPPLSPQEREALLGISQGKTTAETACDMGVSDSTVKTYILRIGGKLGTCERAGMVDLAYRHGHLDVPGPVDHVVELPEEQRTVLAGLAGGKTVEEIAADEKRPLDDVRKDARRLLRALGASSAAHTVTRGWQFRLLGPATGRENSGNIVSVAGQA